MTHTLTLTLPPISDACEIEIRSGLLDHLSDSLKPLAAKFAIITDDTTARLYGEKLSENLSASGLRAYLFSFPHGEQHKTRATKESLENQLFEKELGRDTCVIALGGGVATDIAGYVAATYCRGIPLVIIPTSFLGMVDASIGGKNGVNVPYGKNLIGCIYQPQKVLIDPLTLQTLSQKEIAQGMVEMIKHGLIADKSFLEYLEKHLPQLFALDSTILEKAIFESCRIKKAIVEEDSKEEGKRRLLNFGHTIGHALEKLTDYSLPHGEAVAIGILVESYLAVQMGLLDTNSFERIQSILKKLPISLRPPSSYPVQAVLDAMTLDKKSVNGLPRFVIIDKIGSALPYEGHYCTSIEKPLLIKAIEWMNHDLRRH